MSTCAGRKYRRGFRAKRVPRSERIYAREGALGRESGDGVKQCLERGPAVELKAVDLPAFNPVMDRAGGHAVALAQMEFEAFERNLRGKTLLQLAVKVLDEHVLVGAGAGRDAVEQELETRFVREDAVGTGIEILLHHLLDPVIVDHQEVAFPYISDGTAGMGAG